MTQKASFITFIGAPNAGKSTLLNRLMEHKVSIVTHKAQTTRTSIKGIKLFGETQLIFIDTPGLFEAKTYTDKMMVDCAWKMIDGTDLVCVLVDAKNALDERNLKTIAQLNKEDVRAILIINKIDQIAKTELLKISAELNKIYNFESTFMISALNGNGTKEMLDYFLKNATPQPWPFSEGEITTAPIKFNIAEIVREKLLIYTNKEVPYTTSIEVEHWESQKNAEKILILMKVINKNHKKIILGSQGDMMKKIGTKARIEIEKLLNKKVFLQIHIKITEIDKLDQPQY
jgi:GTPase